MSSEPHRIQRMALRDLFRDLPDIDFDLNVVDWVIDYPESLVVFQEFGIDYCCPGKSLRFACLQANADLASVAEKLRLANLDHPKPRRTTP